MKKFNLPIIISAIMIFLIGIFMMSADVYNLDSGYLSVNESFATVTLQYNVTLGSDSTGSKHSVPIYIGDMNDNDASVVAICNAASDVNVIWHLTQNLRNWVDIATVGLDQVSNSAKYDTLGAGTTDDTKFNFFNYLVIEVDGQAGANQTDTIYMTIVFKKDVNGYTSSGQPIKVCQRLTKSITDP